MGPICFNAGKQPQSCERLLTPTSLIFRGECVWPLRSWNRLCPARCPWGLTCFGHFHTAKFPMAPERASVAKSLVEKGCWMCTYRDGLGIVSENVHRAVVCQESPYSVRRWVPELRGHGAGHPGRKQPGWEMYSWTSPLFSDKRSGGLKKLE